MTVNLQTTISKFLNLGVPVHPAAAMFPLMPDAELDELAADIAEHGLRELPKWFLTSEGFQLLDGRNRLIAIERIGDPDRREVLRSEALDKKLIYSDCDPYGFVISANIRRRHLTPTEKQSLLIELIARSPEKSDRQLAKEVGVDHKTIGVARRQGEDVGKIPHLSMRADTKGRQQPAHKSAAKPTALATPEPSVPIARPSALAAPKPSVPAPQNRSRAIVEFCALLHRELGTTLDDLVRILHDEQARMGEVPHYKRVSIARGYLNALGVSFDDLRPLSQDAANV